MLTLEQIKKAYQLKQNGKNQREIAEEIGIKSNAEISHSINTYILTKEYYEKIIHATNGTQTDINITKREWELLDKEKEALHVKKQKALERESWVKLFVKNIIYKYKLKDKQLKEQLERYEQEFIKKHKDIEQENFSLYFDLQKEIKNKLEVMQTFKRYKFYTKFMIFSAFFTGAVFTIIVLILMRFFV